MSTIASNSTLPNDSIPHAVFANEALLEPDLDQASEFLAAISTGAPVTFQTFSDRDELKVKRPGQRDYDPNARWKHGSLSELADTLTELNHEGAGVFVMVNEGDGQGRSNENVTRVRAVFADFDGAPLPEHWPLEPSILVESSSGRYHAYWLVSDFQLSGDCETDNELFNLTQETIALAVGSKRDDAKALNRVMRLPGFWHQKGEPVQTQLLYAHPERVYSYADIQLTFPLPAPKKEGRSNHDFRDVEDHNPLTDEDKALLQTMFSSKNGAKIEALYEGDVSQHDHDDSKADFALCVHLTFWCNYDTARVDRLFRHSGLYREEKWDAPRGRRTYGQMTLEKVFKDKQPGKGYTGRAAANDAKEPDGSEDNRTPCLFDLPNYFGEGHVQLRPPEFCIGAPFNIPVGYLAALGGEGGTGKSTLAAALGVHVALGKPFLGAEVQTRKVLYVDFELDAHMLVLRAKAVARGIGVDTEKLHERFHYKSFAGQGVFFDDTFLAALIETVKAKGIGFVIIDAYQAAFGGEPKETDKVTKNMKLLVRLASEGIAVLFLDHTPKPQKGYSNLTLYGSAYKMNFARNVGIISATEGPGVIRYQTVKSNVAATGNAFGISCTNGGESWDETIAYSLADLPRLTSKEEIELAVECALADSGNIVVPRSQLIERARIRSGASESHCKKTVDEWLEQAVANGIVEMINLEGRGNPKGYRLIDTPVSVDW